MSRPKTRANAALDVLSPFQIGFWYLVWWIMDAVCVLGGDVPRAVIIPRGSKIQAWEIDWILNPPDRKGKRIRFWGLQSLQIGPYTKDGCEHRFTVKEKQYKWTMYLLRQEIGFRRECAKQGGR